MILKRLGQGLSKFASFADEIADANLADEISEIAGAEAKSLSELVGAGAAKVVNMVDNVTGTIGAGAAKVVNTVDNIVDDVAGGFSSTRKGSKHSYQRTRNKSPRVQREIVNGTRNPNGTRKPKVKEAKVGDGSDVVEEAINKTSRVTYSREGNKFYRQVDGGKRTEIDSKLYGRMNSKRISADRAAVETHRGYTDSNYSSTFTMDEEISDTVSAAASETAEAVSKTAAGDGAGIDLLQFASDHPVGTALAGIGVGIVGTNILDDDEY